MCQFRYFKISLLKMSICCYVVVLCCGILSTSTVHAAGVALNKLTNAAEYGDVTLFKNLLDLDDGVTLSNDSANVRGWLLQSAVKSGNPQMVKVLLDKGVDINTVVLNTSGKVWNKEEDLFYFAIQSTNNSPVNKSKSNKKKGDTKSASKPDQVTKMIDFLVDNGFKPTESGASAFFAVKYKRYDLVKHLHKKGASITVMYDDVGLLQYAIKQMKHNDKSEIRKLIDYLVSTGEIDINSVGHTRTTVNTALYEAYRANDTELVKFLISKGAKNIKSSGSIYAPITPLEAAINDGNFEMAKILKTAN